MEEKFGTLKTIIREILREEKAKEERIDNLHLAQMDFLSKRDQLVLDQFDEQPSNVTDAFSKLRASGHKIGRMTFIATVKRLCELGHLQAEWNLINQKYPLYKVSK